MAAASAIPPIRFNRWRSVVSADSATNCLLWQLAACRRCSASVSIPPAASVSEALRVRAPSPRLGHGHAGLDRWKRGSPAAAAAAAAAIALIRFAAEQRGGRSAVGCEEEQEAQPPRSAERSRS